MAQQQITLTLPDDEYRRFQQHAAARHHSVEEELRDLVASALATDEAEDAIPADIQAAVDALPQLDDAALWQVARSSTLTPRQSSELERLHFKRQRGEMLTPREQRHHDTLMHGYHRALLLRSHAVRLLHERGHDVNVLLEEP